jgi:tetratricopeptide (TPR) repeat protein
VRGAAEYELARCLVDQGRLEEALAALERATLAAPRRHCIASLRARVLKRLGRPSEEAVTRAAHLLSDGERDRLRGRLYARAGQRLEDMDQFRQAMHFLTRSIEADPQDGFAWRERANVRFQGSANDIPEAFVDTYMAAELEPRYSEKFLDLEARLERFTPFLGTIEARIDEIIDENPDLPAAFFFKGYVTFHQGRYEEAERWLDRAFELAGEKSYLTLSYRAAARMRQGRIDDAKADLDRAERLYSGSPVTLFWRACLLARTGDGAGAIAILEQCAARGFSLAEQIKAAHEFDDLRDEPRLKKLVRG